jgi:hypothetical protein
MPSASDAKLQYEAGQTAYAMAALTDSGDRTVFNATAAPWSRRNLYAPVVRPNGVLTGGVVTPAASGTPNKVDVSAGSAWLGGAAITWTASTDLTVTSRANAAEDPTHQIISVVVTGANTVTIDAGTGHTGLVETRDASGGPPLLAAGAIELAQVRVTSKVAAAIAVSEIFAVPGTHLHRRFRRRTQAQAQKASTRHTRRRRLPTCRWRAISCRPRTLTRSRPHRFTDRRWVRFREA